MNNQTTGSGYWINSLRGACSSTYAPDTPDSMITKVVGVTFEGRQVVVAKLQVGEEIQLCRELTNPYDENAIRVERLNREQIGYINRFLAADLADIFDAHCGPIKGYVRYLTGGAQGRYSLGVQISFTVPEPKPIELVKEKQQWDE
jgi:single-stranded-DNA-specific exonuclease